MYKALFLLFTSLICLNSFSQNDSTWIELEDFNPYHSVELFECKNNEGLFSVNVNGKVSFIDKHNQVKYVSKVKYMSNTEKIRYKDKLFFIKYETNNNSDFGLYLNTIADVDGTKDTSLTLIQSNIYDEKKNLDRKTNAIRMKVLEAPNQNSFLVLYDNNYKGNIKEGFKYSVYKNDSLSKANTVSFKYQDEYSKLGNFYYDGQNIFAFVYIYDEIHNNKSQPKQFALAKHNIETNNTSYIEFNLNYSSVVNMAISGFNDDIFMLNGFIDENEKEVEYKKLDIIRLDKNLQIEDSINVNFDILSKLGFNKNLSKKDFKNWEISSINLPKLDNSFPDYLLSYEYTFEKLNAGGLALGLATGGVMPVNLSSATSLYYSSTSNLVIHHSGFARVINDTIVGKREFLVQYGISSNETEVDLYRNYMKNDSYGFQKITVRFDEIIKYPETLNGCNYYFNQKLNTINNTVILPIIKGKKAESLFLLQTANF